MSEVARADLARVLVRIQSEQVPWQEHNFQGRQMWAPIIGAAEEFFEAQNSLGDTEEWLDGVADCSIFLIDLCTMLHVSAADVIVIGREIVDTSGRPWGRYIGQVLHHFLKLSQTIRGTYDAHLRMLINSVGCVFAVLELEVERVGGSYADVLARVWSEVRSRDWVLYPDTGKPPATEEPHGPR